MIGWSTQRGEVRVMGRAMRTTRRAQWQRVGRRASGAGLAWHIWQEQNVPCGNGRMMWRIPSAAHGRFVLRDSSLFQNRTSVSQNMQKHGAPVRSWMGLRARQLQFDSTSFCPGSAPVVCKCWTYRKRSVIRFAFTVSSSLNLRARRVHPCSRFTFHVKTRSRHTSLNILELRLNSSSSTFQSGGFSDFWFHRAF